ncbi:MAG: flotillin domain-containing protein, partial [Acinetobacter sp.]
ILLAQAMEKQYQVDADGTRAVNEANNVLSPEQIEMQIRLALLKYLPEIIRESVKPMENIDDIKILQVNGLGNVGSAATGGDGTESSQIALSDQVVNSALRYRTQAPLIDSLMNELGIQGGDINGLTQSLKPQSKTQ